MPSDEHERRVKRVARAHFDRGEAVLYDQGIPADLATYKPQRPGQKYSRPDAIGYVAGELAVVEVDQVERGVFLEQVIDLESHAVLYENVSVARPARARAQQVDAPNLLGDAAVGALAGALANELLGRKVEPIEAAGLGAAAFLFLRAIAR